MHYLTGTLTQFHHLEEKELLSGGLFVPATDGATYTLTNSQATYTFRGDDVSGVRLQSFNRSSGATTWTNREYRPWKALVFDTNSSSSLYGIRTLEPTAESLTSVTASSTSLVAVWTIAVGTDTLVATLSVELVDDYLKADLSCSWSTGNRWTVDSLCVLPVRVPPYVPLAPNQTDIACLGAVKGVLVQSPIARMRRLVQDDDLNAKWFGGNGKALGTYPSGRTLSMPLWGYYEFSAREAWMLWYQDWANEIINAVYQTDGWNMTLEAWVLQPDNLRAGNGSETPEILGTFCLRAFQTKTLQGWWDVADRYRQALVAADPQFFRKVLPLDEKVPAQARVNRQWMTINSGLFQGDLEANYRQAVEIVRSNIGIDRTVPIEGLIDEDDGPTRSPWPLTGPQRDGRRLRHSNAMLALEALNCHMGTNKPSVLFPPPYCEARFRDTQDWWTDKDANSMLRVSRQGYLDGDTASTKDQGRDLEYFSVETYTVQSYDLMTRVLTLEGNPLTPGQWSGAGNAYYTGTGVSAYTNSGQTKLARGRTSSSNSTTNSLTLAAPGFVTADGESWNPSPGDTVYVYRQDPEPCWHAVRNSSMRDWFLANLWGERRDLHGEGSFYFDVFPAFHLVNDPRVTCHGDHSSWGQINAGYTRHPTGGGNWWVTAQRQFLAFLRNSLQWKRQGHVRFWAEYAADCYNNEIQVCQHTYWMTGLYRNFGGGASKADVNHTMHGLRAAPMWSVCFAGRTYGNNFAYGWGNLLVSKQYRNGDFWSAGEGSVAASKLRRTLAFLVATDWIYGYAPMTYFHVATQDEGIEDPWDSAQFEASHPLGAADAEVATVRDFGLTMAKAEHQWVLQYLRHGRMMTKPALTTPPSPTTLDISADATNAADQLFGLVEFAPGVELENNSRFDSGILNDPENHIQIQECPWTHYLDDEVLLCLYVNAFAYSAVAAFVFTFSDYDLPSETIHVFTVGNDGTTTFVTTATTTYTDSVSLSEMSWTARLFVPESKLYLLRGLTVSVPGVDGISLSTKLDDSGPTLPVTLPGDGLSLSVQIPISMDLVGGGDDPGLGQEDPRSGP